MWCNLSICILSIATISMAQDLNSCITPNKQVGSCKVISQCDDLYKILKKNMITSEDVSYLKASQCQNRFQKNLPVVCCPLVQGRSATLNEQNEEPCTTPRNQEGSCKVITQCAEILSLLSQTPLKPQDANYIKVSQCNNKWQGTLPVVCCPRQNHPTTNTPLLKSPEVEEIPTYLDNPLLPSIDNCGPVRLQDNIYGGNVTDIDEFPWMALIEYDRGVFGRGYHCGGTIISKRYILTAAHCVTGDKLPKSWKVVGVRLGEYDTLKPIDCVTKSKGQKCAPPTVNIAIEETIAHEDYNTMINNNNDIALLRLQSPITFTDYVQPICLPLPDAPQAKVAEGDKPIVAGWGATEERPKSNLKLKLRVPVTSHADCTTMYRKNRIVLSNTQICAGGEDGKDSCQGDSGGPLMKLSVGEDALLNWFLVGVVSFGPTPCGKENWPGVYTKVESYIPWILSKLKP